MAYGHEPEPEGEHLEILRRIATQMTVSRDVGEVLRTITDALVTTERAALARIWLYGKATGCTSCAATCHAVASEHDDAALHLAASAGLYTHVSGEHHRIAIGQLKIGEVAETLRMISIDDVDSDPRVTDKPWVRREGIRSFSGCPLLFRDELVGVLGVFGRERFPRETLKLLATFAPQAATAIKTAQLFSELDRLKERLARENDYLQEEIHDERGFGQIVGKSAPMRQVLEDVQRVGPTDSTVLLMGETGTGKELIADAIHSLSARRGHPMIRVNCGAIPLDLVESELFGHERGSFTSAHARRIGRFELADRSALFLDEVGELPAQSQPALLRVLEEAEFERVGGAQPVRVDVRVIAATNRELTTGGAPGSFRPDLFYRLNVFPIRVPPLRERPEDIPELVEHLLVGLKRKLNKTVLGISPASMERLVGYSWPGNVRELRNVLERACVLARDSVLELDRLFDQTPVTPVAEVARPRREVMTLEEAERAAICHALDVTHGRVSGPKGAAALLAVNPSTLRSRMLHLGIHKPLR